MSLFAIWFEGQSKG